MVFRTAYQLQFMLALVGVVGAQHFSTAGSRYLRLNIPKTRHPRWEAIFGNAGLRLSASGSSRYNMGIVLIGRCCKGHSRGGED